MEEISIRSAKPQVRLLRWTLDHRAQMQEAGYDYFAKTLKLAFPEASVHLVVRRWYGDPPRKLIIDKVEVELVREEYLGAPLLSAADARAADKAAAEAIREGYIEKLRQALTLFREEVR